MSKFQLRVSKLGVCESIKLLSKSISHIATVGASYATVGTVYTTVTSTYTTVTLNPNKKNPNQ